MDNPQPQPQTALVLTADPADEVVVRVKRGRPVKYTPVLGRFICKRIALGESVRSIVKDPQMPSASLIYRWLFDEDKADFLHHYESARKVQAELIFEELLEIADDGSNDLMTIERGDNEYEVENKEVTNRSKLRVETRKWILSKMLPKKYGEKLDVTSDGKAIKGNTVVFADFSTHVEAPKNEATGQ